MFQNQLYTEMNQAVPGSSLSPRMDRCYLECEVPSPSQLSDPCRSPPSLHSPSHFAAELEKLKEEPYSPPSYHNQFLQFNHLMSKELAETSINLAVVLEENIALVNSIQQQQQQQNLKSKLAVDIEQSYGGDFFHSLLDVKKEAEDDSTYVVGSTSISSSSTSCVPQISPTLVTIGDSLRTVELMALDHCRQDVQRVSLKLGIPKDPTAWSAANVRSWLEFEADRQGLPRPSLDSWDWTGMDLIRLTEAQFRELIPVGGELLYAKLEIWREALRTTLYSLETPLRSSPNQYQPPPPQTPPIPQPLSIQTQTGQLYQQHVPQIYLSPPHVSSPMFSPSSLMMTSPTPPAMQLSPTVRHPQPSHLQPSPTLQVPTPVIQAERQQQQQQKSVTQQNPIKQLNLSPPANQSRSQTPPQPARSPFLEEVCMDMTSLQQSSDAPQSQQQLPQQTVVDSSAEHVDTEDETEKEPITTSSGTRGGTHIHLWQFLKELLLHPQLYGSCIRWLDRPKGVFKIEDSVRVARLWGKRKNRPAMNYDKLSRSIRQYYKKGIMKKTERSQRLVYQFCHPYGL